MATRNDNILAQWLSTYTFKDWLCDEPSETDDGVPIPMELFEVCWFDGYRDILGYIEEFNIDPTDYED